MPTMQPTPETGPSAAEASAQMPAGRKRGGWSAGRTLGAGLAGVGGMIGAALLFCGLALICVHGFARDDDGYYSSSTEQLQSHQYAVTTDRIDLGADPGGPAPTAFIGDLRIKAESAGQEPVFVGIGPTAAVERYLSGVGHAEVTDFGGGEPTLESRAGHTKPRPPGEQTFWLASDQGPGAQQIEWDADDGVYSAVVMNADGSRGVDVDASAGVQIGWLIWAGIGLAAIGSAIAAGAIALIVSAKRRASAGTSA